MSAPPRPFNEKAAAVTSCDDLDLVLLATTVQPPEKDRTDVYIHPRSAPFKPH